MPELRQRLLKVLKRGELPAHDVEHGHLVVQLARAAGDRAGDAAGRDVDIPSGAGVAALELAQHLPQRHV